LFQEKKNKTISELYRNFFLQKKSKRNRFEDIFIPAKASTHAFYSNQLTSLIYFHSTKNFRNSNEDYQFIEWKL